MDTLPPKPQEAPPLERERRAPLSQRHSHRSGRYTSRSPDSRYRRSPPRRGGDSYVASPYSGRREGDFYRRDHDNRDRGRRESSRNRSPPRRRDSPYDYNRGRRGVERDRYHDRDSRDRYRDSGRRDFSPRRDRWSRSPRRRSPHRRRSSSAPYRSSPPRKRMRVDDRSRETSSDRRRDHRSPGPVIGSRARSRSYHRRSRSRSRARSEQEKPRLASSPTSKDEAQVTATLDGQHDSKNASPVQSGSGQQDSAAAPITTKSPMTSALTSPGGKQGEIEQPVEAKRATESVNSRDRSPSPPRQPRHRGPLQSPPRGPRAHPRGSIPPTGPALSHPAGPRAQRRAYPSSSSLPAAPHSPYPALPTPMDEHRPPLTPVELSLKIPMKKVPPSLTPELDAEMAQLQAHRSRLASEYVQIAKEARRALHELDMANIDLRAAELRRRVADSQYEKARNGVLGVDYVQAAEGGMV